MNGALVRRVILLAALAGVAVFLGALTTRGDDAYELKAQFRQAGGLRQGFKVRIDGAPVGKIDKLELNDQDLVVATLKIDKSAAPVGRGVRATARAADLLGEKFIDLEPGDRRDALKSGAVIPPQRTGLAIELDDVINAVDLPTRKALRVFVNEQGAAYVGRGRDLGKLLAALPGSLDRTGELLDQFSTDNKALGRLIDESDRVVASVAAERAALGHLVGSAAGTLEVLGTRRRELAETVRQAPSTLAAARRALASLQGAAVPLGPAARGLRRTAPQLTSTLKELPQFTASARPTLRTVRNVSPTLQTLGRRAAPIVRRLQPLASELDTFATAFDPVTQTFDKGIGDVLGVLEGWARSTQARDAASHVFRFGLTVNPLAFISLKNMLRAPERERRRAAERKPDKPAAAEQKPAPPVRVPKPQLKVPRVPDLVNRVPGIVDQLTQGLGLTKPKPGSPPQPQSGNSGVTDLLDLLVGP